MLILHESWSLYPYKVLFFTLKRASNKYFTHTLAMLSRHWL